MSLSENQIRALWHQPESEWIEWKPSLSQTDSILKAVCAFANNYQNYAQPGVIFIGREDDGSCSGYVVDDATLRDFVGKIRAGSILPLPNVSFQQLEIENCAVVAIIVEASASTPVSYGGVVYIRLGPSSVKATPHQITELTERRTSVSFDATEASGAAFSDLDFDYLQREYIPYAVDKTVIEENNRSLEDQLAALRILTPRYVPTYLGVLVGGKNPRSFLPGAYIQFLRIDGDEHGDPVKDHVEIDGLIRDVLRLTYDKVRANINYSSGFDTSGLAMEKPDYPFDALREFIANAIVHRDYAHSNAPVRVNWFNNRIEIISPGPPFGRVTIENFGQPNVTDYRNPELAAALKYLGFVQRFGFGIPVAQRSLLRNANPAPDFDISVDRQTRFGYVAVTLRKAQS